MANGRVQPTSLKTASIVVGIVVGALAIIGGVWSGLSWAQDRVTKEEAKEEHGVLHRRISDVKAVAEDAHSDGEKMQQTIGRDVAVIKCLLRAPNRRAKERCGLED